MPRPLARWLFGAGAGVYRWFTAQDAWQASCAALASRLPPGERPRVVDLGCGPGNSTAGLAAERSDARLIGLDVARRMLAYARRDASRSPWGSRVSWVQADGGRLPLRTASIDAVTGHSFLYLVPDQAAVLAEALRVLRPGGRLVLMEPNARPATIRAILRVSRDPRHVVAVGLWRPFSRLHGRHDAASLAVTLERSGFVRCRVEETLGGLGLLASGERPAE
ncbi:MAG TPA: class I SAM-dependent methyltransferase [Candidatus Dormibacteraeota bacterium]|nr:class I SAM-dependent methyltransferase [Candidatus Dormibacteraeota bacterium]